MALNYSIIVPFRDKYELFLKAIESIPDRADIQVIIVDNAPNPLSEDSIPVKTNAQVYYTTSSPVNGAGCARNVGLKYVKGRYILFLDADDFFTSNAFRSFDKYLDKEFEIVFFQADSINLHDGSQSTRHHVINNLVETYLKTGDEGLLRYRFVNPIAKLFKAEFVITRSFTFDEIRVSNDVWFSLMTGHAAFSITADPDIVYMITMGERGSSLSESITEENWFIRYKVMVRVNKFLKSVDKYHYRIRLLGAIRIAWKEFGFLSSLKYIKYAMNNRVGIL